MTPRTFEAKVRLPASPQAAWDWHARPGAFERLAPPWQRIEVLERTGGIERGGRLVMRVAAGPLAVRWIAVHGDAERGRFFEDAQESGPFAAWRHRHLFRAVGPDACELEDRVTFALPGGAVGNALGGRAVERTLERLFAYRHAVTAGDLERHSEWAAVPRLRVGVTGATGLLGRALCAFLTTGGHQVRRFGRGAGADVVWDPEGGRLPPTALEGLDAVVHLAGENVAGGRWTETRKRRILQSRVNGTAALAVAAAAAAGSGPRALVCASAVGYYGNRPSGEIDESSEPGEGFLADVVRAWEAAAEPAARAGLRVASLRFGVVLSAAGGAVAKMLPAFRLGAGGPVGSGRQGMSWVALDDVLGAILFVLMREDARGPINVTAPAPVSQSEFAAVLGRVLSRPAFLPLPSPVVRALFGQMGREMLLDGQRVVPAKLRSLGFRFRFASLEEAIRFELGRLGP